MRTVYNESAILASNKILFGFPTSSLFLWSPAPANRGFPNPLETEKELELTSFHNLYPDTTQGIFLVYLIVKCFWNCIKTSVLHLECFYLCAVVEQQQQNKNQSRWQHRDILGLFTWAQENEYIDGWMMCVIKHIG